MTVAAILLFPGVLGQFGIPFPSTIEFVTLGKVAGSADRGLTRHLPPEPSPRFLDVFPPPAGTLSTTGGFLLWLDAHTAGAVSRTIRDGLGPATGEVLGSGMWKELTCARDDPSTPGVSPDDPCGLNVANPVGYVAREAYDDRVSRGKSEGAVRFWDCDQPGGTAGVAPALSPEVQLDPRRGSPVSLNPIVRSATTGLGNAGTARQGNCDDSPTELPYGSLERPYYAEDQWPPGDRDCEGAVEPVNEYVVGFHEIPYETQEGKDYYGGTVIRINSAIKFAVVEVRADQWSGFYEGVARDGRVRYCHPPVIYQHMATPNDPLWSNAGLNGLRNIRADEAWDTTFGSTNKVICIVDTGVRYTHEDLSARWIDGYDYVNNDNDPMDDQGHGTHVAGTAAGTTNNNKGVAGVAQVGIKAAKVLNSAGSGTSYDVADGITWCADNGADVISMSLGGSSPSLEIQDAVEYAYSTQGKLLVAASGNYGPCANCVAYPAAYPEVIAVNSLQQSNAQCAASSDGPESELSAPGHDVLSTVYNSDTAYGVATGCWTSMATPHVSGAAALLWSYAPALTNEDVRRYLICSANDLGTTGWDEQFGYGLVDAREALDRYINDTCKELPPVNGCDASFRLSALDPQNAPTGGQFHGPQLVEVVHSGSAHVVGSPTVTASPAPPAGVLHVDPAGHDAWTVSLWESGQPARTITFTVNLANGQTCTGQWDQYN